MQGQAHKAGKLWLAERLNLCVITSVAETLGLGSNLTQLFRSPTLTNLLPLTRNTSMMF